jgi:hypothetical protein
MMREQCGTLKYTYLLLGHAKLAKAMEENGSGTLREV